jgi:peptidoglycan/LPS O-acetylase OafA/YrhL
MVATTATCGRFYRPELDVLRFVAFLLVFLYHTLPDGDDIRVAGLLRGFAPIYEVMTGACLYGLSLFFTLSAFLICELLLREREASGAVGVSQFYIRRILRIWPLYYLALALGVAVALLPGGHPADLARIGWFALFMGAWDSAFHSFIPNPVAPLWSVSVEEQFYLFAPWVVKYLNRKLLYEFCLALILLANVRLIFLSKASASGIRVWTDTFVQFECFAAGILLCLVLRSRLPRIPAWQRLMLLAGGCICWLVASDCLQGPLDTTGNLARSPLISAYALATLGSVLLILAVLGVDPKRLPAWAISLGRISFGLYVYHAFAIYLSRCIFGHFLSVSNPAYYLKTVLAALLTFLMAALSYRYIETPFLRMKKRHAVIESQPIQSAG